MKRDMDLVRAILLAMEESEHGRLEGNLEIPGYDRETIQYHAYLMDQAGLIKAADVTTMGSRSPQAIPIRLNWDGHEFLDAARDDTIWQKAKKTVGEKVGQTAFAVVFAYLQSLAKEKLGLDT